MNFTCLFANSAFFSFQGNKMETKKTVFFLLLVSSPVAKLTKEKEEDGGEYSTI